MIAETAIVYPGVELGNNVEIGDFCIVGHPLANGDTPSTYIGDNSTIRSHTVIYAGNKIGQNFVCGHKVNIREKNSIGNNVSIGTHSVVEHQVVIESNVRIHTNVFIPEFSHIKENAWIGPNVVLTNAKYPKSPSAKVNLKGPTLEPGSIIGANSTLLPGVQIGSGSVVGAGSLVTHDIPAGVIAFGAPAKVNRLRSDISDYK